MKCIAGLIEPDAGVVVKARDCSVGYLPQEGIHLSGRTLRAEAESAFAELLDMQEEIHQLSHELNHLDASTEIYHNHLERIGELELILEHHDLSKIKPRVESILRGLGFKDKDFERDCGEFSGGWQMRLALAKLLLQEPDVLLLDEPTNHLDIESQRWMEVYLQNYRGAIILISHDIALLDALVTRTIAFHHGRAEEYSGNFSYFLTESVARREILRRRYTAQQRELAKSKQFIDRFRAKASKASLVQSRIKQMEKIELITLEDDDAVMDFRFPPAPPSGQTVVRLDKVSKHYGELTVFDNFSHSIEKGDHIAIVGVNGAGKSTFSRLISGQEAPDSGTAAPGHNTLISFFSQNHADELNPDQTVLEAVEAVASREALPQVRNLLGCFLFRGDDVLKRVGVLSGGERSRVALVRMLVQPANFLILDEPTNHLDIQSQEVLQRALNEFSGTFCIVSHNRRFLDPVVTKVLEFRPNLPPRVFLGNVSDYIEKKEAEDRALAARLNLDPSTLSAPRLSGLPLPSSAIGQNPAASSGIRSGASSTAATSTSASSSPGEISVPLLGKKEQKRREAELRERRRRELKPLEDKLHAIEKAVADLEKQQITLTESMSSPQAMEDSAHLLELSQQYEKVTADLEKVYSFWAQISDKVDTLNQELGEF